MKSVAELLKDKNYELLAKTYFDWVAREFGHGDYETGIRQLALRYNGRVFSNIPFHVPLYLEVEQWLKRNGITKVEQKTTLEINRCFDDELKNRIEEELHHQNPLNP